MTREEFHQKRAQWTREVQEERQKYWQSGHPNAQVAVTEMAIRELFDRVAALEDKGK
jgi:hypothetical protein